MRLKQFLTRLGALSLLVTSAVQPSHAAPGSSLAEMRAILEGTWQLVEWHVDGKILRPPEIDGRWSNHDGVAITIFYRRTGELLETSAHYGTYQMDANNWAYQYLRMQS